MGLISSQPGLRQVVDLSKRAAITIRDPSTSQLLKIMKVGSSNFELSMEVIKLNKPMPVE